MGWDAFFPEERAHATKETVAICKHCPVKFMCLEYAIKNRIEYGMWGGFSPKQRERIRKQRRRMRRDLTEELTSAERRAHLHLASNRGEIHVGDHNPERAEQALPSGLGSEGSSAVRTDSP